MTKRTISIILLALSIALVSGCASSTEKTVAVNDTVSIDYTGWLDDGTIFDTSNESVAKEAGIFDASIAYGPYTFIAGTGEVIPGFDDAIIGMKVNESRNITLTPDQAYGTYDPSLIQPMNMSDLTDYGIIPQVNDTLYYGTQPVTVYSIPNNTTVLIDFNHPLAGKTLHFTLTVRAITAASAS